MTLSQHQQEANPEQPVSQEEPSLSKTSNATAPFSKTLSHLPRHYFNALVKPSVATYTGARGNESWGLVWIQLLAWAILDALLGVLVNLITPPATGSSFLRFFAYASSYGLVGVVPLLFFLLMGIVYLLARYFGGQGSFLEQCNTSLYIQAPLGILSKLLALIPVVGRILNTILSIYGIVLQVYVIIAVHRLSRGKAIATIVIPLVIIGVFAGAVFLLMRK